jgi:hypothetical protein
MSAYDMVAFIVLVGVIGGVLRAYIRSRSAGGVAGMTGDQQARLGKLEERVKALEAVVGDSSYELKQKLKDLERAS